MEVAHFTSPEFWKSFAPALHLGDPELPAKATPLDVSPDQRDQQAALMKEEGYFQGTAEWALDIAVMAATVRALAGANLPPVAAFVYDEFWIPFFKLHSVLSGLLGEYRMLPDCWIWNVDPEKGDAGWRPHRDRDRQTLLEDGLPKSLTVWIPLSDATPLNGCLYIVPALHDPTYGAENEKEWKFEYSSIRALPASPGDYFIWNQAVVHWGGKSSPRAKQSRVSMSFEFQRADAAPFNNPLMQPMSILPFDARIRLIAKQILQYRHMYSIAPHVTRAAWQLLF